MVVKRFRAKERLEGIGVNVNTNLLNVANKHVATAMQDIDLLAQEAGNLAYDMGKDQAITQAKKDAGEAAKFDMAMVGEPFERDENGILRPPEMDVGTYSFYDKQYRMSLNAAYVDRLDVDTKNYLKDQSAKYFHDPKTFMEVTTDYIKTTTANVPEEIAALYVSKATNAQHEYSRGIVNRKAAQTYTRDQKFINDNVVIKINELASTLLSFPDVFNATNDEGWIKQNNEFEQMLKLQEHVMGKAWVDEQIHKKKNAVGAALATSALRDLISDPSTDDTQKIEYNNAFIDDLVSGRKQLRFGKYTEEENTEFTGQWKLIDASKFNFGSFGSSNKLALKKTLSQMSTLHKEAKSIRENIKLQKLYGMMTENMYKMDNHRPEMVNFMKSFPISDLTNMQGYEIVSRTRTYWNSVLGMMRSDTRWDEWSKSLDRLKSSELTDEAAVAAMLAEFDAIILKYPHHSELEKNTRDLYNTLIGVVDGQDGLDNGKLPPTWGQKKRLLLNLMSVKRSTLRVKDAAKQDAMAGLKLTALMSMIDATEGLHGMKKAIADWGGKFKADDEKGVTQVDHLSGVVNIINKHTMVNNLRVKEILRHKAELTQAGDDAVRRQNIPQGLDFLESITKYSGSAINDEFYDKVSSYKEEFKKINTGRGADSEFKTLKKLSEAIAGTFKTILAKDKHLLASKKMSQMMEANYDLKIALGLTPAMALQDQLDMEERFENVTALLPLLASENTRLQGIWAAEEKLRLEEAPIIIAAKGGLIKPSTGNAVVIDRLIAKSDSNPEIAARNAVDPTWWRDKGFLRAGLGTAGITMLQGILSGDAKQISLAVSTYNFLMDDPKAKLMAAPHLAVQLDSKTLGALQVARKAQLGTGGGEQLNARVVDALNNMVVEKPVLASLVPDLDSGRAPVNDYEVTKVINEVMQKELDAMHGKGSRPWMFDMAFELPLHHISGGAFGVDHTDNRIFGNYPKALTDAITARAKLYLPDFQSDDKTENVVGALVKAHAELTSADDPEGWGYSRLLGPGPMQGSREGNFVMVKGSPEQRFQVPYIFSEENQDPANPTGAEWILPVLRDIFFNRADFKAHGSIKTNFKGGHSLGPNKSMFLQTIGNNDRGFPTYKVGIIDHEGNVTDYFVQDRYTKRDLVIDFTRWEVLQVNLSDDPDKNIREVIDPYKIAYDKGEKHVIESLWRNQLHAAIKKNFENSVAYKQERGLLVGGDPAPIGLVKGDPKTRLDTVGSELWRDPDAEAKARAIIQEQIDLGKRKDFTAKRGRNIVTGKVKGKTVPVQSDELIAKRADLYKHGKFKDIRKLQK